MTISLIYPPACDPTAPYLSIPTLAAWLHKHGKEVLPIDANVEAYDLLNIKYINTVQTGNRTYIITVFSKIR